MQTNNQLSAKDIIEKDIIELLGGGELDDDQKAELYKKMMNTINMRVLTRIDESLSDEEVLEWQKKIEEGDQKKVAEYLEVKGVDVGKLMAEEALRYKSELLAYDQYQKQSGKVIDEAEKLLNPEDNEDGTVTSAIEKSPDKNQKGSMKIIVKHRE